MAQTSNTRPANIKQVLQNAQNLSVSVAGTGNTTLLDMTVSGMERLMVQFSVITQALDTFLIQGRCSRDATLVTLYSTAADFTSPAGLLLGASGDLTTTAAAGSGWFIMDVRGLWDVRILASAAADSAVVTIYAGGQ